MKINPKQLFKCADIIRDQLEQYHINRYQELQRHIESVTNHQTRIDSLRHSLDKSVQHQWHSAAKELIRRLQTVVQELPYSLNQLSRMIQTATPPLPALRDIYEELMQLQQEFTQLTYNKRIKALSVITEPIELEGFYLGDFELRLYLDQLAELKTSPPLRVIALDPHPACSNEAVMHPHVSDECMCVGDAMVPMYQALQQGRINDFFLLAKAVLENYNPSSPFVALSDWEGISCYACSYSVHEDDSYYCEQCENTFCNCCMSYCDCCQYSVCLDCVSECSVCLKSRCSSCMETCSECGANICQECIDDNLCPSCKQERETQDEDENQHVA